MSVGDVEAGRDSPGSTSLLGVEPGSRRQEGWRACAWKHPRAPSVRKIFGDEQAMEVVLTFLRDVEVGCMVSLAPPEEEGEDEWEEDEGEEGGLGPP